MNFETFLKNLPFVLSIITSQRTRERLAETTQDVAEAVKVVSETTQEAAQDITEILTDMLEAMDAINTPRRLRSPEESQRIAEIEAMFHGM